MEFLKNVSVTLHIVDKFKKRDAVIDIFKTQGASGSVLIVEKRENADFLASFLSECDYKTTSVHGARYRSQRVRALYQYNTGQMGSIVMSRVNIKFGK